MVLGLGGREIETTPEHPFWVRDKGWTAAGEIEPGEELRSHDGQWISLDSKQLTDSIVTVYNMRVAEDHTYFVGSPLWGFTVWAHNTCTPIGFAPGTAVSATTGRVDHASRHLIDAGILSGPKGGKLAREEAIKHFTRILENPIKTFEKRISGQLAKGFLGKINGRFVVIYVAMEDRGKALAGLILTAGPVGPGLLGHL